MKFVTLYEWNRDELHGKKFASRNTEDSMTQQSDLNDSDINVILKKYGVTGQIPGVLQPALYGDFSNVTDYRTAVDMVRAADEAFQEIPAKIREDFDNDPVKFMEFAQNPENIDKLREYGLANPIDVSQTNGSASETPERYDDNYGAENDASQRVLDTRQQDRRMEPPILPTNPPTRTANVQNRSEQQRPK